MDYFSTPQNTPELATIAQVTDTAQGHFGTIGTTQQQGIFMFGPRGVSGQPKEKDRVLLLSVDGVQVCLGVLGQTDVLDPGELLLQSDGGALLHLKNNGEIVLNGLRITKDGQMIPPKGGTP